MTGLTELPTQEIGAPYPDAAAELADHLLRLNGLLGGAVERFRRSHPLGQRNGLDGVAIFDDEIDRFLSASLDPALPEKERAAGDRLHCERRAQASAKLGIELPIGTMRRRFGLAALEVDALVHCIAAELHPGYGRVFAYLQNDLARQRPSVASIVEVLSTTWAERLETRRVLGQRSPLFRCRLLVPSRPDADHLTAELAVDPSVLEFILGGGTDGGGLSPGQEMSLDDLLVAPAERCAIERIAHYLQRTLPDAVLPTIVVLSGAPGVGKRSAARAVCNALQCRLRSTAKGALNSSVLAGLADWLRDARLVGNVPACYIQQAASDVSTDLSLCIEVVAAAVCPLAFLLVESDDAPRLGSPAAAHLISIHLSGPNVGVRSQAWSRALHASGLAFNEADLGTVAAVYPFTVGRIFAAAREAGVRVRIADPQAGALESGLLARVCREQSQHRLDRLAESLPIRHSWDDIVLPPDDLCRLKEIANAVRNREHVMERWGFERKVSAGPGVNAIFFGPSGTGKTMAASIVAGDLGMEIYRVDLSRVVSKYIGETERNLDTLFDEARRSFAMLFFDEAEALFGKRSEVKDAHDRYANIEVAYLLQRMEAFPGVAILATNLRKHMDTAFLRRLQFAVEFPLPTVADRLRIWQQVWPPVAELDADIDLQFMARHLELSGGHIRNVALTAAFLASEKRSPIGMAHIVAATRREFQKLGRHCAPDQFGPYASLLEVAA